MRSTILAVAALLAGCAAIEPQRITGPSGKPAYFMQCSGQGRTLAACYQKAGEVCPAGYSVVDRASDSRVFSTAPGQVHTSVQHALVIECR